MFALLIVVVPGPSSTNVPGEQAASAVLSAAAANPAAMVDPHCVRAGGVHGLTVVSPVGNVAGRPFEVQSIAREAARMLLHDCASAKAGLNKSAKNRNRLIAL